MDAVVVENLGKAYKQYSSRWSRLFEWFDPFNRVRHGLKWILRDVSFTVRAGEAVGIIGINGAGKSTLLKIISGTTRPTCGATRVSGRLAAILELGMGFHPDFTGRENVYTAGQLLGFQVEEITPLLPSIIEFSELGEYIDQPVRIYSSGMQMRLAFSVATMRRPDILIIDEALSVGDIAFQHKCFDRIRRFRQQGTTLLLVSHDKGAIQSMCDRAILLNASRLAMQGDTEEVFDYYNAMLANDHEQVIKRIETDCGKVQTISGSGEATIRDMELLDARGGALGVVRVGEQVVLRVTVDVNQAVPELVLGFMIKDRFGQAVFGTNSFYCGKVLRDLRPGTGIVYHVGFAANVGPGTYSIACALHTAKDHIEKNFEWRDVGVIFNVVNMERETFSGIAWLPSTLDCRIEEPAARE
jgi:lipopolysaccharide transport system ATP-binding protein